MMVRPIFGGSSALRFGGVSALDGLFRDMDQFFHSARIVKNVPDANARPGLQIIEREGDFLMTMMLPGIAQSDLDVSVLAHELTIKVEAVDKTVESYRPIHRERRPTHFWRKFTLPKTVDVTEIKAEMTDGVLRLVLPKRLEAKKRKIQIKVLS